MPDRFYLADEWNKSVILSGSEAQHLAKVLRKQVGDVVELFDGQGKKALACVESISKREIKLTLTNEPHTTPLTGPQITLAVAPPKGDRFRWLVEKTTELGVQRLIPLITDRSVVHPGETKLEKLRHTMIAACKQSGRNHFMEITSTIQLDALKDSPSLPVQKYFGAIPDPAITSTKTDASSKTSSAILCIGPEGGFARHEIESLIQWNAEPISISNNVLRVETASIALVSALIHSL